MTTQEQADACTTLDQLADVLNAMDDSNDVDMHTLPTFGGAEPEDTDRVWSWDKTRLLVQTNEAYEIVDR